MLRRLAAARARASALVQNVATPSVRVLRSGTQTTREIPVRPHFSRLALRHLEHHSRALQASLIDSTGEGFGFGFHASELHDARVQGAFRGGQRAARRVDVRGANAVHAVIAGSGNAPEQAANMARLRATSDSIAVSTTSGGWPQNLSRLMRSIVPDQGTENAAFTQGLTTSMLARMVRAGRSTQTSQSSIAGFSQGATAFRDAQDALTPAQLLLVQRRVRSETWGGPSGLRVPHTQLRGTTDPVPLLRHVLDRIRTTRTAEGESVSVPHTHNGIAYAQSARKNDAPQGKPRSKL